jgi:CheY-like chemotaxis protein
MEKMLVRLAGEGRRLTCRFADDGGIVSADPSQLEQILANLVVNAREAMIDGGEITIETHAVELDEREVRRFPNLSTGAYVLLVVGDTGPGISENLRKKVLEPFYSTRADGTGLGLAIVKTIVEGLGGSIEVESRQPRGTEFRIFLPRAAQHDAKAVLGDLNRALYGNETIFILEDDEAVRSIIQVILREHGYKVLAAGNAEEAHAVLKRHEGPIDVILADVVMPEVSGARIARDLAAEIPNVKVLFMSGYPGENLLEYGLNDREDLLLKKPFSTYGLLSQVRSLLAAHSRMNRPLV